MSKFYVQCGPVEVILLADSPEHAALTALDRSLQSHLWIYDDADLSDQDRQDHLMVEALLHLEPTLRVSEQGFDRSDATVLGTPEMIFNWHRLMVGMNRLFQLAGLLPRSMAAVASGRPGQPAPSPRSPK